MTDRKIAFHELRLELKAAEQYDKDLKVAKDPKLIKILKHNKKDEVQDHAAKLTKYIEEKKEVYV